MRWRSKYACGTSLPSSSTSAARRVTLTRGMNLPPDIRPLGIRPLDIRQGRGAAARRMPPAASELGQLRAGHGDPYQAPGEIDDQGGVVFDTDDPAEPVLIVCYLILLRE